MFSCEGHGEKQHIKEGTAHESNTSKVNQRKASLFF